MSAFWSNEHLFGGAPLKSETVSLVVKARIKFFCISVHKKSFVKPINFLKIKFPFPGQTDQRIEKNSVKSIKFFRKLNFRFRSVSGIENSILKKSVKLMSPYCVLTSARRFAIIEAIGKYRRGKHRRGDQLSVDEANIDEADIGKFYVSSFFG